MVVVSVVGGGEEIRARGERQIDFRNCGVCVVHVPVVCALKLALAAIRMLRHMHDEPRAKTRGGIDRKQRLTEARQLTIFSPRCCVTQI